MQSMVRAFLPKAVVRLLKRGRPRAVIDRQVARLIDGLTAGGPVRLALFDPATGLAKAPQSAGEILFDLRRKAISDAAGWLRKVGSVVPPGGVVFDVGAYRGITAQWFAGRAAIVYAFEPMPENAESIRQVLGLRGIENVRLVEKAVSDRVGRSALNVCAVKGHNSLGAVRTSRIVDRITVETTPIDDLCAQNAIERIDFLKIDVEGFEYEVLAGAERMLREGRIRGLIFEVSPSVLDDLGKSPGRIYDLLRDCRYVVRDLDGRGVDRNDLVRSGFGDFLALPESP